MDELTVEPSALNRIATEYANQAKILQEQLNLVIQANENISNSWISGQATTYTTKITNQQTAIQKMIDTLNDLSTAMANIANTYKQIQDDIAASLGGSSAAGRNANETYYNN